MDDRHAALDAAVARAADAWITDARDTGVYARLVNAVLARRAYLQPELEPPAEAATDPELLDALADAAPATAVGELLTGGTREVLARLRQGPAGAGR